MTPSIKSGRLIALATVAIAACVAPVAAAHDRDRDGRAVVAPARGGGLTGGELLRESWATGTYAGTDPSEGACKTLAPNVLLPHPDATGIATCDATTHTRLFVRFGSACFKYDLDPPSDDPEAQLACALASDETMSALHVRVDRGDRIDLIKPRYELVSPQGIVQLPPDNFFGLPPGPVTFTAHAWGAVIRDLRPGRHSVTLDARFTDGYTVQFTAILKVARESHSGDHDAD